MTNSYAYAVPFCRLMTALTFGERVELAAALAKSTGALLQGLRDELHHYGDDGPPTTARYYSDVFAAALAELDGWRPTLTDGVLRQLDGYDDRGRLGELIRALGREVRTRLALRDANLAELDTEAQAYVSEQTATAFGEAAIPPPPAPPHQTITLEWQISGNTPRPADEGDTPP